MMAVVAVAGSDGPSSVKALSVLVAMLIAAIIAIILGWKLRGLWIYRFLQQDKGMPSKVPYSVRHKIYDALGNKSLASLCADVAPMERESYALTLMTVLGEDGTLPRSPDGIEAVLVETRRRYEAEEQSRSSCKE